MGLRGKRRRIACDILPLSIAAYRVVVFFQVSQGEDIVGPLITETS
jgi:hypothetical protein